MTQPEGHRCRRRIPLSAWAGWEPAIGQWLDTGLPVKRMLELARADATTPFTASAATWYRLVQRQQRARAASAPPVIRFEGLPGEFLQVDWGEAWIQLLSYRPGDARFDSVNAEVGAIAGT
ncbi:MAG: hypothetical protein U0807_12110 [Candidatus Binatia bacterium]